MKVSVYCTAYNHEKYIRSALEGFVNQKTTFEYEVIVHDDASTDNTASIIREYAERYPQVIRPILQTENQYSKGIDIFEAYILPHISGEYIASCEGDDYWIDENKLQMQVDFLDSHPEYSACAHNSHRIDMRTQEKSVMFDVEDYDIQVYNALNGLCYQTASLMYRRQYANNRPAFYYNAIKNGFGDVPQAIFLALNGPIRYLGRIMSVYRFGTESSWTTGNRKDMSRIARHQRNVSQMFREVNEFTGYAYNEQIDKLVLYNDYQALYFEGNYSEMKKPEYREFYDKESVQARIKMIMKRYFKLLYRIYRKMEY